MKWVQYIFEGILKLICNILMGNSNVVEMKDGSFQELFEKVTK
ncbi:hypothetical protein [Clostridium subterminale]